MEISYLAFPNGGLTYNCPPCGRCCKGYGFGGKLADVSALMQKRPYLVPMTHYKAFSPDLTTLFNVSSGCFMLTKNGCQLESWLNHASKPLVCNLFPFTEIVLLGTFPVLLPQLKCPLEAARKSRNSDHDLVLRWLSEVPLSAFRPQQIALPYRMMGVSLIRGEAFIRDNLPKIGQLGTLSELVDYCIHLIHSAQPVVEKPLEIWADCLRVECNDFDKLVSRQFIDNFVALIPTLRIQALKEGIEYAQLGAWLAGLAVLAALFRSPKAEAKTLALDLNVLISREAKLLKLLPIMLWPVILPPRAEGHKLFELWNKEPDLPFGEIVRQYLLEANSFSGLYLRAVANIL